MIDQMPTARILSKSLINKYARQNLSRQERVQIVDSMRSSLPENIKRSEGDALRALVELSGNETIDLRHGFAYINTSSIIEFVKSNFNAQQILESIANTSPDPGGKMLGKSYLRPMSNMGDYSVDHPIMQLATNPVILGSIANYLGEAPLIHNCQVLYSPPRNQVAGENVMQKFSSQIKNRYRYGSRYQGSQLWHIDEEYPHTLKLWVYLTDVGKDAGPFNILPGLVSDEVVHFLGKDSSKKVTDSRIGKFVSQKLSIEGKSNTVFLADTGRCYHYGSRDVNEPGGRVAVMIHYTSIYSIYAFNQSILSARARNIKRLLSRGSSQALDMLTRY